MSDKTIEQKMVKGPEKSASHIWWDGDLMPWENATVQVTSVGWPALSAVFEGIRAYAGDTAGTSYIFRAQAHFERFWRSMRFMWIESQWSIEELTDACVAVLKANGFHEDAYLQPMAFSLGGSRGSQAMKSRPADIYISTRKAPSVLGKDEPEKACISSWTRIHDAVLPPRIKAVVNYQNSRLGASEAERGGYDSAIFLNEAGKVAEGGGSCLFLVRDGKVITPPLSAGILESITRFSVIELLRDALGVPVEERTVDRSELYFADEMFFCGTMHELSPVGEVDGYTIGSGRMGEITKRLHTLFEDVVRGRVDRYRHWLTPVTK